MIDNFSATKKSLGFFGRPIEVSVKTAIEVTSYNIVIVMLRQSSEKLCKKNSLLSQFGAYIEIKITGVKNI